MSLDMEAIKGRHVRYENLLPHQANVDFVAMIVELRRLQADQRERELALITSAILTAFEAQGMAVPTVKSQDVLDAFNAQEKPND